MFLREVLKMNNVDVRVKGINGKLYRVSCRNKWKL